MEKEIANNESLEKCLVKDELQKYYALMKYKKDLCVIKSNFSPLHAVELQNVFSQRLDKGIVHAEVGTIKPVEFSSNKEEADQTLSCYFYAIEVVESSSSEDLYKTMYILCFLLDQELTLELFRTDLEKYCSEILRPIKEKHLTVNSSDDLSESFIQSMEDWYSVAIEFLIRSKEILADNLKNVIYSALYDHRLTVIGGTVKQQTDIQRFYDACGLSNILNQLRESRYKAETGSLSSSVDMLADVDSQLADGQGTLDITISADGVKLNSTDCNKFCEEWATALNRPEFENNPTKQKQVIEAFKLKFIQTMNTLKRHLRESVNDFYALYRSYKFMTDSGNSEILLHFVTTEGAADTSNVLCVLKEFLQEQKV